MKNVTSSSGSSRLVSSGKALAVLVALLALSIGSVAKLKPELFMTLPFPLSIILHTAAAGGSVPPYFMPDAWADDEIGTWTNPNDVIVSAGAKSGTNWMLYCTHQIRMKGSANADALFNDVNQATPWMDLKHSRGGSWAEQKERYNTTILPDGTPLKDRWDNARYPFRIFKSHYGPKESGGIISVTSNPQLKFIAMSRDGLDVVNAFVPFFSDHNEVFRKVWGGFPPDSSGDFTIDAEDRLKDLLPGGLLDHLYFDYVKSWWPLRNEPNVLLLHYSDAKKDLEETVRKIAGFSGIDLSESELSTVVERCGIDHMKKMGHMFDYDMYLNTDSDSVWDNTMRIMKSGMMIREGKVGGYKGMFTEEQIQRWRSAEDEVFGGSDPEMLQWARRGGLYS